MARSSLSVAGCHSFSVLSLPPVRTNEPSGATSIAWTPPSCALAYTEDTTGAAFVPGFGPPDFRISSRAAISSAGVW